MKAIETSYKISNRKINKELSRKLTESDKENLLSLNTALISNFEVICGDSSESGSMKKVESDLEEIHSYIVKIMKRIDFGDSTMQSVYTKANNMIASTNTNVKSNRSKMKQTLAAWKSTK